jgi:hypothetical protein
MANKKEGITRRKMLETASGAALVTAFGILLTHVGPPINRKNALPDGFPDVTKPYAREIVLDGREIDQIAELRLGLENIKIVYKDGKIKNLPTQYAWDANPIGMDLSLRIDGGTRHTLNIVYEGDEKAPNKASSRLFLKLEENCMPSMGGDAMKIVLREGENVFNITCVDSKTRADRDGAFSVYIADPQNAKKVVLKGLVAEDEKSLVANRAMMELPGIDGKRKEIPVWDEIIPLPDVRDMEPGFSANAWRSNVSVYVEEINPLTDKTTLIIGDKPTRFKAAEDPENEKSQGQLRTPGKKEGEKKEGHEERWMRRKLLAEKFGPKPSIG